jgi:hypothetical protein
LPDGIRRSNEPDDGREPSRLGLAVSASPLPMGRDRRNGRHADGATAHRLDNQCGRHAEPPHGRSLAHADAPPHVLERDALAYNGRDSLKLLRLRVHQCVRHAHDADGRYRYSQRDPHVEPRYDHSLARGRADDWRRACRLPFLARLEFPRRALVTGGSKKCLRDIAVICSTLPQSAGSLSFSVNIQARCPRVAIGCPILSPLFRNCNNPLCLSTIRAGGFQPSTMMRATHRQTGRAGGD